MVLIIISSICIGAFVFYLLYSIEKIKVDVDEMRHVNFELLKSLKDESKECFDSCGRALDGWKEAVDKRTLLRSRPYLNAMLM